MQYRKKGGGVTLSLTANCHPGKTEISQTGGPSDWKVEPPHGCTSWSEAHVVVEYMSRTSPSQNSTVTWLTLLLIK